MIENKKSFANETMVHFFMQYFSNSIDKHTKNNLLVFNKFIFEYEQMNIYFVWISFLIYLKYDLFIDDKSYLNKINIYWFAFKCKLNTNPVVLCVSTSNEVLFITLLIISEYHESGNIIMNQSYLHKKPASSEIIMLLIFNWIPGYIGFNVPWYNMQNFHKKYTNQTKKVI